MRQLQSQSQWWRWKISPQRSIVFGVVWMKKQAHNVFKGEKRQQLCAHSMYLRSMYRVKCKCQVTTNYQGWGSDDEVYKRKIKHKIEENISITESSSSKLDVVSFFFLHILEIFCASVVNAILIFTCVCAAFGLCVMHNFFVGHVCISCSLFSRKEIKRCLQMDKESEQVKLTKDNLTVIWNLLHTFTPRGFSKLTFSGKLHTRIHIHMCGV